MAGKNQDPRIAVAIKNRKSPITGKRPCKHSLQEFATLPKREYYKQKSPKRPKEQTIGELIAAGSDPANVMSSVCQLTNDIHPVFRDENICACEYADGYHCVAPRFTANPEGLAKTPRTFSPYPKDNIVVRTVLQLASQTITHDQTLPFWAGIIDAIVPDDQDSDDDECIAKVHPTRRLDAARKQRTLQHLEKFSESIRVHFKAFVEHDSGTSVTAGCDGYPSVEPVRDTDPDYKKGAGQFYAWRDDKATIEAGYGSTFIHLFLNLQRIQSLRFEALMAMTIREMKVDIFRFAVTTCHEFAHALERHYCDRFNAQLINDELMVETGFSLENFLFGGLFLSHNIRGGKEPHLRRWPSMVMHSFYKYGDHPLKMAPLKDMGPERCVPIELRKCALFLEQSFWDDPKPPVGCWKKMWLRPHCEVTLDEEDYDYFTSGSRCSFLPHAKRRRLSDAAMERERAYKASDKWDEYMEVEVRWHRKKDASEERRAVFHERETVKLNGLWAECTKGIDDQVFLK